MSSFIKGNRIIYENQMLIMLIMEHQKIFNSLNEASDSKFMIRKWKVAND